MRYGHLFGLAAAAVVAFGGPVRAQSDCESARCAVQAAIDQQCPCTTALNHGRHVSCVAHVVNQLSKDNTIPINCKGKITRCAARSICGKTGFVTCQVPLDTCDLTTGTCVSDSTIACKADLDCGSRCSTKRDAPHCTDAGGTVGAGTTCCAACATTP
jgi:hypothetical protein